MMNAYLGCDIGGTSVKYGLFDEEGQLLQKWSHETRTGENGSLLFDDLAGQALEAEKLLKKTYGKDVVLKGLGMGIPAPVEQDGYIEQVTNLKIRDLYPAREAEKRLPGIPVFAENDANAAALGEKWKGAGQQYSSLCMVTIGTGIGGGIIVNGSLVSGSRGCAGEIGHIRVNPEEKEACGCGARGCVEQYASATGIVRTAERLLAEKKDLASSLRLVQSLSAKAVCDAAAAGDEPALMVLDHAMEMLALALSQTAVILDPEVFIIGGGVSGAGPLIAEMLRKKIDASVKIIRNYKSRVLLAKLGNDAGIYGAAFLALRKAHRDQT